MANHTNTSRFNVTSDDGILTIDELAPFWFKHILPIIIVFFGLIGNTLTALVLNMKKYRTTSTCFYMKTLALSDNSLMILFFIRWLNQLPNVSINQNHFCIIYFLAKRVTLGVSAWTLMLMTLDKYLSTRFPLHAKRLCSIKRARISIFVIIFVYVVAHLPYFWTCWNPNAITLADKCPIQISEYFVRVFTILRILVIDSVLPWFLISLFTVLLSRELYLSLKRNLRTLRLSVVSNKTPRRVKYMAISDSWAFFFLTFPASALDVTRLFATINSDELLFILYESFVYLVHLNSAIHFYFYIIVSKKFRYDVIRLLSKKRK